MLAVSCRCPCQCVFSPCIAEPDMDPSVWTDRNVTFKPSESSYDIDITCPIRPLVNHPQLYTYEWRLRFSRIPDSNSPDLTVAIEPSSSFYQCEVNIQHGPDASREYDGSEIYIETFSKLLGINCVCQCVCCISIHTYITEPWAGLNVLSFSLSHTHSHHTQTLPLPPLLSSTLHSFLSPSLSDSLSLSLSHTHTITLSPPLSLPLTAVLAALEGNLTSVTIGNSTNLSCPFSSGTEFDIYWTVDDDRYNCDNSDTRDGGISCTNSTDPLSQSILSIEDTNSLGAGNHAVQCVLEQTIPDNFKNDLSFRTELNDLTEMSMSATLMIIDPFGECVCE